MDIRSSLHGENLARACFLSLLLTAGLVLGSCSGDNAYPTTPGGPGEGTGSPGNGNPGSGNPGSGDQNPPSVSIQLPTSNSTVAVGDSLFAQVQVSDDVALASLELSGFALRGDRDLGTEERVDRFGTKIVDLNGLSVRDTTLMRYLIATADTLPESPVYLVATAIDAGGNVRADTLLLSVGGPRVGIASPANGGEIRGGTALTVRVAAADRIDRIRSVRLRLSGAATQDTTLSFSPLVAAVDTAFVLPIPAAADGDLHLDVFATNSRNLQGSGRRISLRVLAPSTDETPPTVRFTASVRERAEIFDTLKVTVSAIDDTRVDSVGVSVAAVRRVGGGTDTLRVLTRKVAAGQATFRFGFREFNLPTSVADTLTIGFEVTAFARDAAGNCAAATVPDTDLVEPCRNGTGFIYADRDGSRFEVVLTRGRTIAFRSAAERIADLISDGSRVYLSNFSRNRVDVVQVGDSVFRDNLAVGVGSEPWGLALGRTGDTLFVANSGGTNISVVPLAGSGSLSESRRIRTSDIRLFDINYDVTTDTVATVVMVDYSDRPQFLGQTSTGQILYSTKPTPTRSDGTIRIFDAARDTTYAFNRGSEIFVNYATPRHGKGILVNALDAGRIPGGEMVVCPRRRTTAQSDPACVTGRATQVRNALAGLAAAGLTDTRLDLGVDVGTVGLTDTTFVAVSGNRSTVAFGEGAVDPGRIMLFRVQGGELVGSSVQTQDLIGNAAERVIGLGLNHDGSLGAARGNQVYFFDPVLRLQGIVQSGTPSGGVALHPANNGYPVAGGSRLGFVSGFDERGTPYIDVVDTYSFRSLRRIHTRDAVVGAVIAVPVPHGDPAASFVALRLFALTKSGLVQIDLAAADLAG